MNSEDLKLILHQSKMNALDLSHQQLNDDNIYHVIAHTLKNQNIMNLDLSNNKMTDSSVSAICSLLSVNQSVTHLDLEGNEISQQGINKIAEYITRNATILDFNTEPENMTKSCQEKIEHALFYHQYAENGIANESNKGLRQNFVDECWMPFRDNCSQLLEIVKLRTRKGYDLAERLPSQKTMLHIQQQCYQLTEMWYGKGRGNLSCVYGYFYAMCEAAHVMVYRYDDIGLLQSEDGYLSDIDAQTRAKAADTFNQHIKTPYIRQGGLVSQGPTPIDDLNPANIVTRGQSDHLLTWFYIKQLTITVIMQEQLRWFAIIEQQSGNDLIKQSPDDVKRLLKKIQPELSEWGLQTDNLIYDLLLQYGEPLENWGQLPQPLKEALYDLACKSNQAQTSDETDQQFTAFAEFIEKNPGRYYDNLDKFKTLLPGMDKLSSDQSLHEFVQTIGVLSGKLAVVKRSNMENLSIHRYLSQPWQRQVDLIAYNSQRDPITLRAKGAHEQMRIRINQFPYKPLHCISISSSGLLDGLDQQDNETMYNWNVPQDADAKQTNLTRDIEKMVQEALLLNPLLGFERLLPGECFLDVTQNTRAESSIKGTQHTHIARGCIDDFLLYQWNNNPLALKNNIGQIDVITVGESADACFVKITSANPNHPDILNILNNLRLSLLEAYEDPRQIDFTVHVIPNGDGQFVFILAPHTALERHEDGSFINPETQHRQIKLGTPLKRSPKASSGWPNAHGGRHMIAEYYDFAAKPGIRKHIDYFIKHFV